MDQRKGIIADILSSPRKLIAILISLTSVGILTYITLTRLEDGPLYYIATAFILILAYLIMHEVPEHPEQ